MNTRQIAKIRATIARIIPTDDMTAEYLNQAIDALGHALTAERMANERHIVL